MDTTKARQSVESVIDALLQANKSVQELRSSLATSGKVLWVNIYRKNGLLFFAGSDTFESKSIAESRRSTNNPNLYVGAFSIGLGDFPEESVNSSPSRYTSLAAMDWQQQDALATAAKLYYTYKEANKISVIKFIRTLTNANLIEAKELVDYAIAIRNAATNRDYPFVVVPPTWFKQKPY